MKKGLTLKLASLLFGVSLTVGTIVNINEKNIKSVKAETQSVTYKAGGTKSSWSCSTTGTAPEGSSVSYTQTYDTLAQMTKGNSVTYTMSGYDGCTVTSLSMSMHSNKSAGTGNFSLKAGSTVLAEISSNTGFNQSAWNGAWTQSYTTVTPTMKKADYVVGNGEKVVLTITASANSLFCESITLGYTPGSSSPLSNVEIKSNPTKTEYEAGQCFNPAGLVIKCNFEDGSSSDVAYDGHESKFTFNPSLTTELQTTNTKIDATYDGVEFQIPITVTAAKLIEVSNVEITNPSQSSINIGEETLLNSTATLTANVNFRKGDTYKDGNSAVTWSSNNASVVSIDASTGVAKFLSNGTAVVTATSVQDSSKSASVTYNVENLRGTTVDSCMSVADIIDNYSSLSYEGTTVFAKGYISSWYKTSGGKSYAYIADTATTSPSKKIEIYNKLDFTFENGTNANDYEIGSLVIFKGKISYYKSASVYELVDISSTEGMYIYSITPETISGMTIANKPSKLTYAVGEHFEPAGLKVTLSYSGIRSSETITYGSSTASQFSFEPSLETALTAENTKITVTVAGQSCDIAITMDTKIHTTALEIVDGNGNSIENKEINIPLDEAFADLKAILTPTNSEDDIEWTSSNEDVALLENDSGVENTVCVGKLGSSIITATSNGKSDSITVNGVPATDEYVDEIAIVVGADAVLTYYAGENTVNTIGLSVTATMKSASLDKYSRTVENYTNKITWTLDRELGLVIATYDNSDIIYDIVEVNVFDTERPIQKDVTFDLSKSSYYVAEEKQIGWKKDGAVELLNEQGTATAPCTNWYPGGGKTSTRFYKNNDLTISSCKGYVINYIEFYAATEGYAEAVQTLFTSSDFTTEISGSYCKVIFKTPGTFFSKKLTDTIGLEKVNFNYEATADRIAVNNFIKEFIAKEDLDPIQYGLNRNPLRAGGACLPKSEGGMGYYDDAIEQYNTLNADAKEIFGTNAELADARARLQAWATANGKTITFDATTGAMTINSARNPLAFGAEEDASILIVTIVTCLTAFAGVAIFLRKKKRA